MCNDLRCRGGECVSGGNSQEELFFHLWVERWGAGKSFHRPWRPVTWVSVPSSMNPSVDADSKN